MPRHQVSNAEKIYFGDAYYARYAKDHDGRRGIQMPVQLWPVTFGAVDVADVDGVCAAQAVASATTLTVNGALATSGVATMDVPRALVIDSTDAGDTTQTLTITGTDEYGATMVETISANGTTAVNGKKAFKTVTEVSASAAFTGNVTVGTTDILGLPFRIDGKGDVLVASADGVAETATIVVADTTDPATATDGDVRGTIDFNTAADGTAELSCLIVRNEPTSKAAVFGVDQYSG